MVPGLVVAVSSLAVANFDTGERIGIQNDIKDRFRSWIVVLYFLLGMISMRTDVAHFLWTTNVTIINDEGQISWCYSWQ